ncbi:hypothetical protein NWF32_16355 [Pseudomonas qingdaonensis]|nr:hypothetical protein [Pseudomonas qingdaonensis]
MPSRGITPTWPWYTASCVLLASLSRRTRKRVPSASTVPLTVCTRNGRPALSAALVIITSPWRSTSRRCWLS